MHSSAYPHIIAKIGNLPPSQQVAFSNNSFFIDEVQISAHPISHDSSFCVGYSFNVGSKKISIITDVGTISQSVLNGLSGSDILYIEANHCERMLMQNQKYSALLKRRILSSRGHLSNIACAEALTYLIPTGVKQVVLSHLSEENNTPSLAYTTIKEFLSRQGIIEGENVFVDVAAQNKIGTLFEIED
jgi:phosphoribosyl 1,2-cyclic phosphodiesterase